MYEGKGMIEPYFFSKASSDEKQEVENQLRKAWSEKDEKGNWKYDSVNKIIDHIDIGTNSFWLHMRDAREYYGKFREKYNLPSRSKIKIVSQIKKTLEWPEIGELVIGSVYEIPSYGFKVKLVEYGNKDGLVHISEVSSGWVRDINDFVQLGQNVVLGVIRVDKRSEAIDLNYAGVSEDEKNSKIKSWTNQRDCENLFYELANNEKIQVEQLYDSVGVKIVDHFGSLYKGFEALSLNGFKVLTKIGVKEDISKKLEKEVIQSQLMYVTKDENIFFTKSQLKEIIKEKLYAR